jgi:hypothetical protein
MTLPVLTEDLISTKLAPWKKEFKIVEDGTSQTHLANKGRFGFFVEKLFGILPNKNQLADYNGTELKAVSVKNGKAKSISIGTISFDEYRMLKSIDNPKIYNSIAYKKMKKTLYVFYSTNKINGEPFYAIDSWYLCDYENLNINDKLVLEDDFKHSMMAIEKHAYDSLGHPGCRPTSATYLDIGYKGKAGYNYPCWQFTSQWMNKMYNQGQ